MDVSRFTHRARSWAQPGAARVRTRSHSAATSVWYRSVAARHSTRSSAGAARRAAAATVRVAVAVGGRAAVLGGRSVRRTPSFVWVLIALVLVLPVVWINLTGLVAGLLSDGAPVLVGPIGAWSAFLHLLADGFTRNAWPDDLQQGLGRWRQIRAAGWVAGLLVLGLVGYSWALLHSMKIERFKDTYRERSARWAVSWQLRRLQVFGPRPGRMILGVREGRLLAAQSNASVLIIAPAQAGKTSGLAVPVMVEWTGPILATTVKGDLLKDTLAARRRVGEVKVFDPTGSTSVAGSSWSPVAAATSWSAARRIAASILQIGMRQHGGQDDTFWRQAGASYLAPLLLAGNYLEVSTAVVLRWATSTKEPDVKEAVTALKQLVIEKLPGSHQALHDLQGMWGLEDSRYRSSVIGTLSTHLDAWKEPALERATAGDEDAITPEWLLDGNNTLFLSAPASEQRRLRGLFSALVIEVVNAAFARAAKTGEPLDPRLLLMMDEAANIAPLPNIDEIASTGPGQGVLLCTILQNLSQAEEVWGKDRADTIMANHRARLFGSGIGDASTLDYIGRILGEEVRESTSISRKRAVPIDFGQRTESLEYRPLMGAHEIRQIPEGTALFIYGNLPPTMLELRYWPADRRLRNLVEGKGPKAITTPPSAPVEPVQTAEDPPAETAQTAVEFPMAPDLSATAPTQLSLLEKASDGPPPGSAPRPPRPASPAKAPVRKAKPKTAAKAKTPSVKQPAPAATERSSLSAQSRAAVPSGQWFAAPNDPRARLDQAAGEHAAVVVTALRLASLFGLAVEGPIGEVLAGRLDGPLPPYPGHLEVLENYPDREHFREGLMARGACQDREPKGGREWWTGPQGERLAIGWRDAGIPCEYVEVDGIGRVTIATGVATASAEPVGAGEIR